MSKLARSGSLLFLGGSNVVRVVDARNPARLRELAWLSAPSVEYLEVMGDRLVLGGPVVEVLDVSQPRHPRALGGVMGGGEALQISGGVVYSGSPWLSPLSTFEFGPEYAPTPERDGPESGRPDQPPRHHRARQRARALSGAPDFDARDVDLDSLRLGAGEAQPRSSFLADWNRDGLLDASALFWVPTPASRSSIRRSACAVGRATAGRSAAATRFRPLAGCGDGFAAALIVPWLLPLRRAFRASTAS